MSAAWAAGSTRAWRVIRTAVLARDAWICHWCGGPADQADHLIPKSHGGTDELDNLVAACAPCNRSRGAGLTPAALPPSRSW